MDCTREPEWKCCTNFCGNKTSTYYTYKRSLTWTSVNYADSQHTNLGTSMRGTDFVNRNEIQLTNINIILSGRGMAAEFREITPINIYVPSGTAKWWEREHFYDSELAFCLRVATENIILGGEFNCLLEPADTTDHYAHSRALEGLVQGLEFRDIWW